MYLRLHAYLHTCKCISVCAYEPRVPAVPAALLRRPFRASFAAPQTAARAASPSSALYPRTRRPAGAHGGGGGMCGTEYCVRVAGRTRPATWIPPLSRPGRGSIIACGPRPLFASATFPAVAGQLCHLLPVLCAPADLPCPSRRQPGARCPRRSAPAPSTSPARLGAAPHSSRAASSAPRLPHL